MMLPICHVASQELRAVDLFQNAVATWD